MVVFYPSASARSSYTTSLDANGASVRPSCRTGPRPFAGVRQSDPFRPDPCAGGQPLADRRHRLRCLTEDSVEPVQGEAIGDLFPSPLGVNEAAVAKTGEVRADTRLGLPYLGDQLADGHLSTLAEQLQDANAGRIAQNAEEAGGRHRLKARGC